MLFSQQLPVPEHGGEEVGRRIDEILARPEFQEPPKPLLDRLIEEVDRRLADLFDALTSGGRGSLIAWLLVIALVAVVAVMVTRLVRSVGRDPVVRGERVDVEQRRPAVDWRTEADVHEGGGRWRDSISCR